MWVSSQELRCVAVLGGRHTSGRSSSTSIVRQVIILCGRTSKPTQMLMLARRLNCFKCVSTKTQNTPPPGAPAAASPPSPQTSDGEVTCRGRSPTTRSLAFSLNKIQSDDNTLRKLAVSPTPSLFPSTLHTYFTCTFVISFYSWVCSYVGRKVPTSYIYFHFWMQ